MLRIKGKGSTPRKGRARAARPRDAYTTAQRMAMPSPGLPPGLDLDRIADEHAAGKQPESARGWDANVRTRKDGRVDRRSLCPRCQSPRSLVTRQCSCDLPGHGQPVPETTAAKIAAVYGCSLRNAERIYHALQTSRSAEIALRRSQPAPAARTLGKRGTYAREGK